MRSGIVWGLAVIAVIAMALGVHPAMAQQNSATESRNRVAVHNDWSVFMEETPLLCWSVSQPRESVHTRDGRVVSVRRSQILLLISFNPKDQDGWVSFHSGYPYRDGSEVSVNIDGQIFEMFTGGETAWTNTDEDDTRMIRALKLGGEAVVTGVSRRGTTTKDTFSLLGVTAATEDAQNRCRG